MKIILLSLLLVICFTALSALAQTNPGVVQILTLPEPPTIDGNGSEWPDEGVQEMTGPDGSASFQIAADAENFYALVHVNDDSPLKNSASRTEEAIKGGDAISFFLGGERGSEQRVVVALRQGKQEIFIHRPQSRWQRPYTFVSPVGEAHFDFVGPARHSQVEFRTTDHSYTAEIRIPWASIDMTPPPAEFPFEAQVIFSDMSGSTNASMAWWHSKGSSGDTVEDLPTEARLYPDTWGKAAFNPELATQIGAIPAPPPGLPVQFELPRDGRVSMVLRDSNGWIVRELLASESFTKGTHSIEWDGRDRYGEALPPGKYTWNAMLFDGMGTRFMGSVGSSGRPPYRTEDRLGSMGGQHGLPTALASDAGGIYMASGLEEGWPAMRKVNATTGEALWVRSTGGFGGAVAIATEGDVAAFLNASGRGDDRAVDLVRINPETGQDVEMGGESRVRVDLKTLAKTTGEGVTGMAIAGKRAYYSEEGRNRIGGMDLETGDILPDIEIEAPLGLMRWDEDHLLVCTGTQVVRVNVSNRSQTPVLQDLIAPRAVTRDAEGNLYVSDLGESQQIKKFNAAGELIETFGLAGGKPPHSMVPYNPLAFRNVTVLAVGPEGNLWMAESEPVPKRFVKITTQGEWMEDFYGPVAYNTFGPDLNDPSIVYYNPLGGPRLIETKVDYDKYRANPKDPAAAWQVTGIHDLSRGADGISENELMGEVGATSYGHIFSFTGDNGKKYLFRPSKRNRASAPPGSGLWIQEKDRWVPTVFLSSQPEIPSWSDLNGDGLMQDNERFTDPVTEDFKFNEFGWIDADLTQHGYHGKLAPASVDERGVPVYNGGEFSSYLGPDETPIPLGWNFMSPQVNGATYFVRNIGPHRHMSFWDRASENQLVKVADGEVQWIVGESDTHPRNTEMSTVTGIAGVVDGLVLVHIVEPAIYIAFTEDGLNLGNVIVDEHGRRPANAGPNSIMIESFTGLFTKHPETGERMLFAVSSGDDRILEVTGPGETTRFNGEITLTTAPPRRVEPPNETVIPYQSMYGNVITGQGIDGYDYDWHPEPRGLPIYREGVLIGDIRLRRDYGALHVLANVLDPDPLQEGEGIFIEFAPEDGGKVDSIFVGAIRFAEDDIETRATVNDSYVVGQNEGDVKVAVQERWHNLGYRLEAEIPLSLLSEVSASREQSFRRGPDGNNPDEPLHYLVTETATLPDLIGPVRLRASIRMMENGALKDWSWPAEGAGIAQTPND